MTEKFAEAIIKRYGKRTFDMNDSIYQIVGYKYFTENGVLDLAIKKVDEHFQSIGTNGRFTMELHNYYNSLIDVRFYFV
jgi:GTP1/Obg family GTP-binding protein